MKQRSNRIRTVNRITLLLLAGCLGHFSSSAQLVSGLTAVDVGAPPLPGSSTSSGPGAFAVTGSGEYKNGTSDNFQYAYTNVTGDFDYRVRVVSVEVPSTWSKAGMMARETTDATVTSDLGSRCITMTAYPPPPTGGNTYILVRREQANTVTADDILGTTPAYPNAWLRLRRLGDTMIGYTGTNGLTWDVQGIRDTASWPDGPLSQNLLLGLAVASAKNTATCTAQCQEFGAMPKTNGVVLSVPLKSLTVNKGRTAIFSVTVSGYDPFYAQWYTNGTPIPGATNYSFGGTLTYTTPVLSLADDNTVFSVVVSNSVNTVSNGNAVLRVVDDHTPPVITAATTDGGEIDVLFNEEVSTATALDPANYTLNGVPGVDIFNVSLSSNQRVAVLNLTGTVDATNATLAVTRVQDLVGNVMASQSVPFTFLLAPSNIVVSGYQSDRATAFASVTDGIVDGGWQTTGDKDHRPQFAGLIYTNLQTFTVVKLDLGLQNEYGGSFAQTPNLYLLKNNVDTDQEGPETDPTNWVQVQAELASPNLFDANVDPNPSPASPSIFDLSALSPTVRSAYGWAIGGVSGDNSGFIRISELRGYGQNGGVLPPPGISVARNANGNVVIAWPSASTGFVLQSTPSLSPATWSAVTDPQVVDGANLTVTVGSSNATRFFRLAQ